MAKKLERPVGAKSRGIKSDKSEFESKIHNYNVIK